MVEDHYLDVDRPKLDKMYVSGKLLKREFDAGLATLDRYARLAGFY